TARLRIGALVFLSVRQADAGAINDLGPQAVPPRGHSFAGRSYSDAHAAEPVQGQSFASLAVGAGVFIDRALVLEGEEGLDLADDFTAGGIRLEHLAQEAKEGAAHAIDALAAVAALVGLGKQAG